jgi:hypothetical protein
MSCSERRLPQQYDRLLTGTQVDFQKPAFRQYPLPLHGGFTFSSIPDLLFLMPASEISG